MNKIIVAKFGGSSMQDHQAMLRSAQICLEQKANFIIVSAIYGTTNQLHQLCENATCGNWNQCERILFTLKERHLDIFNHLSQDDDVKQELLSHFQNLETLLKGVSLLEDCSAKAKDRIVSFGEKLSSLLFSLALKKVYSGEICLFDSTQFMKTNSHFGNATPTPDVIKELCKSFSFDKNQVYIGAGYIGSDKHGLTTTLGRGGSDYSAALFAQALGADILQIWTDVPGLATTDPKICENTKPISEISYQEAGEMAQYGAKILHPATLVPAMEANIPVFVGSSIDSQTQGTWIKNEVAEKPLIRAITKRDQQALLTITAYKRQQSFNKMEKIFHVFNKYEIPVDCITTSEIAVAISVDEQITSNQELIDELATLGEIKISKGYSLISLVGNSMLEQMGLTKRVFSQFENINIRMLCLGASAYNFNMLVNETDANQAVKNLHSEFIS